MVRIGKWGIRSDNGIAWVVGEPYNATLKDGRDVVLMRRSRYFTSPEAARDDVARRMLHGVVSEMPDMNLDEFNRHIAACKREVQNTRVR